LALPRKARYVREIRSSSMSLSQQARTFISGSVVARAAYYVLQGATFETPRLRAHDIGAIVSELERAMKPEPHARLFFSFASRLILDQGQLNGERKSRTHCTRAPAGQTTART
jgi:hypothetical protein